MMAASATRYRLVIFDFDGTLADSFPWFLRHVNAVADRFNFRRVADADIPMLRRSGPHEVIAHLGVSRWKLPLIARHTRQLKSQHLADIPLFPGVASLLATLAARGIATAMVSSDNEDNVRRALGENARLIGHYDCGASLFGKAAKFRRVVKTAGVAPGQALAIGDELRDLDAARKAGIAFGAVSWGYSCPQALQARAPDLMFSTMDEITAML